MLSASFYHRSRVSARLVTLGSRDTVANVKGLESNFQILFFGQNQQGCQNPAPALSWSKFVSTKETNAMKTRTKSNTTFMRPQTHSFDFYKDNTGWYIDFPEFIEQGLGTKGDLAINQ